MSARWANVCWLTVAAIVLAAAALGGQERPNFSGTWSTAGIRDYPWTHTGNANRREGQLQLGMWVTHIVIRQDTKVIEIVEENDYGGPNTLVYHLDGSAVTNPLRIFPGNEMVDDRGRSIIISRRIPSEFTTRWKDAQLVSAITTPVPGEKEPRHYEETISLGADGLLCIRTQRVGTGDSQALYYKKQ